MADPADETEAARPSLPAASALRTLREQGAQGIDPVGCDLIEALLQRADRLDGPARHVLDDRLLTLLGALRATVSQAQAMPQNPSTQPASGEDRAPSKRTPLADLVAHIAQQKTQAEGGDVGGVGTALAATASAAMHPSPVDASTLLFFRRTWSKLNADQRLAQSRSSLPDNAGPLNSHHLVHRSLNVMRELSPDYFNLFISHVDALMWLQKAGEQAAREASQPARSRAPRKPAGGRHRGGG